MDFWQKINDEVRVYVNKKDKELLETILLQFTPYLKTCARKSQSSAIENGVFIPFEEFYSKYLVVTWKAIEDFRTNKKTNYKFKNIFLHRLFIAEKDVWRIYRNYSGKPSDKNGMTYESSRWLELEESKTCKMFILIDENRLIWNEIIRKYRLIEPKDAMFFSLILKGYSSSEAAKCLFFEEYNAQMRKKIERMRCKFKKYLEKEGYFSFSTYKLK
ncbi:hypothetical protein OU491_002638 [Enterococcus hirae]|nr:hypothetical protein [Enterococcus hirae]